MHRIVEQGELESISGGLYVGRIVGVTAEGRPLVDFPGNAGGAVPARCLPGTPPPGRVEQAPILLAFEGGDRALPIILGFVRNELEKATPDGASGREAVIDGKRITLDAREEILLRCGKSSILLRKDGTISVRGARIVSRASGTHKIKGASVSIN